MEQTKSAVSTTWVVIGILLSIVVVAAGSYISNYNYGNRAEKNISAQYTDMENVLAQGSLKVKEVAQVPGMMADDLARVSREAISGRYGAEGSKAVVQWIRENYPGKIDPSLYTNVQRVIESFRDKFENSQRTFIDAKRSYETNLGYFWKGFWLWLAGYPKLDLNSLKIISSEHAQDAFRTGVDTGIQLR